MARKANRFNAVASVQQTVETVSDKSFRTGMYARLSTDIASRQSDSIQTQIDIMRAYVKRHPELGDCREYVDKGFTGTNFDRPGFNSLMDDIRDGKINCILVKDLSRFGRDYLETTNFIEVILPFLGVRFISVNDHFDTDAKNNENKALEVALKNLVNDMYAKDVSKRLVVARKQEMERGKFTGSNAPYGYKVNEDDPLRHYVIDESAAEVVREIYRMAVDGKSVRQISIILQERNLSIPGQYLKTGHLHQEEEDEVKIWHVGTISNILRNQAYIGNLVQGKRRTRLCDNEKRHFTPKDEWLITEGTHEPIVSRELYDKVRRLFDKKVKNSPFSSDRGKDSPRKDDKYFNLLFCGTCGKRLQMHSRMGREKDDVSREYFYQCGITYDKKYKGYCKSNIMEWKLDHIVLGAIKKQAEILSDKGLTMEYCEKTFAEKMKPLEEKILKAEQAIKKQEYEDFETHEKFGIGEISRKELEAMQKVSRKKMEKLKERLDSAQEKYADRKKEYESYIVGIKAVYRVNGVTSLDRETLVTLIDRIVIHPTGDFEITWNFEKGFRTETSRYRKGAKSL